MERLSTGGSSGENDISSDVFFDQFSLLQEAFILELVLFSSGGPPLRDINFSYVFCGPIIFGVLG